jgi:hypothetical protein
MVNPYTTFPIYIRLKERNPWNSNSIVINSIPLITTEDKVIHSQFELDLFSSVQKYLIITDATDMKESIQDNQEEPVKAKRKYTKKNKE